jgi:hypothetical protein
LLSICVHGLYHSALKWGLTELFAKIAGLVLIAGLVIGTASVVNAVAADKSSASNGLEIADLDVYENTGSTAQNPSSQDIRFHEGTCQGGNTTAALQDLGGCGVL